MQETANGKIHKLEVTDDTLTSRGGLAFFVKYLEAVGIVGLLLHKFAGIKKSIKGVSVRNLFLQVLYFFFDGTSRHLSYFDELQREEGYQAVVEMPAKQMASSHAMKRFFRAFAIFHAGAFRWVLQELFLWRLRREKMRVVMLTLDTMVMDNDEALQREGCDPTYTATCKAAGYDCLTKEELIKPRISLRVAYEVGAARQQTVRSPRTMYPRLQNWLQNREATVYLPA